MLTHVNELLYMLLPYIEKYCQYLLLLEVQSIEKSNMSIRAASSNSHPSLDSIRARPCPCVL